MTEKASWSELKSLRGDSEGRHRGYQDAKDAFELGGEGQGGTGTPQAGAVGARREEMGTTQPTIARLEAGGVTPSLDTLHPLSYEGPSSEQV